MITRFRAFSLVELLLVLVLMGIFAGAVTVSLAGRGAEEAFGAATADLASVMNHASVEAKARGVTHGVAFRSTERGTTEYRVERVEAAADSPDSGGWGPASGIAGRWRSLAPGVHVTPTSSEENAERFRVRFPDELLREAALRVWDDRREAHLTITRETGRVVVDVREVR